MKESGHISINAENILPIIKRWLYSEKEIFLRELVANASDAITKLHKLALAGEEGATAPETKDSKITIKIDTSSKTLTISDTGLGMTADEIKRYINQVAFSGLQDFIEKYKDKADEHQIIGHFGLGFYSSYMVANTVEIDTLSYQEGSQAAHWTCDGSTSFTLDESHRKDVGTSVILHLADDSKEMLEPEFIRSILHKYCMFIRYPIELVTDKGSSVVNDPIPLWTKSPAELEDKHYLDFFHRLFPMATDPLFWIHLNVDYPFKISGILFFPKLRHELDGLQGEIKLYCNQVYVADNPKELIPEYLTLLKGAIDCPELPLNVARSHLQNDPQVQTISQHIAKKVADRLIGMAKTDREHYEQYWDDIHPFIKFGMMRDHKFSERLADHLMFKTIAGKFLSIPEYLEVMKGPTDGKVIYVSNENTQAGYISMFKNHGLDAVIASSAIDTHFIPFFEHHNSKSFKFQRIDADLSKALIDSSGASNIVDPTDRKTLTEKIESLFLNHLSQQKVKVRVESLKSESIPAILLFDEQTRRYRDMSRFFNETDQKSSSVNDLEHTLMVNQNNPAIKNLVNLAKSFNKDSDIKMIIDHIYDLASLQQGPLSADRLQAFLERSTKILEKYSPSILT